MYVRKKILFSSFCILLNGLSFAMDGRRDENKQQRELVPSAVLSKPSSDFINVELNSEIEIISRRLESDFSIPWQGEEVARVSARKLLFKVLLDDKRTNEVVERLFSFFPYEFKEVGVKGEGGKKALYTYIIPMVKCYKVTSTSFISPEVKLKNGDDGYEVALRLQRIVNILIVALLEENSTGQDGLQTQVIKSLGQCAADANADAQDFLFQLVPALVLQRVGRRYSGA